MGASRASSESRYASVSAGVVHHAVDLVQAINDCDAAVLSMGSMSIGPA